MAAWVTKEWYVDGKRRRERTKAGMKGVNESDQFVVEWISPTKRRHREKIEGSGRPAKRLADLRCDQINSAITLGTYEDKSRADWSVFRQEYNRTILVGLKPSTRGCVEVALKHFERIVKPAIVSAIDSQDIDRFIAERKMERGKKPGSKVSPATINRDLRHIKAVFRIAHDWEYVTRVPRFRMLKEPKKLVRFVTPDHFVALYTACDAAERPAGLSFPPADWWRALLLFNYMTGWRVSEPLALRRDDLNLESGVAITRADDNKGARDERVPLHPLVVEHLKRIQSFEDLVFSWPHRRDALWDEFHNIQTAAEISLPCSDAKKHQCTPSCHFYGFHDLRRAFATQNAPKLSASALQSLMRHKSFQTTQLYINMSKQLDDAVEALHTPMLPKTASSNRD